MTDRVTPQSKGRFRVVNCAASVIKDMRTDRVKKVMAVNPRDLIILQNVIIQPLDYG